jgi:hypothetical protein
VITASTHVLPRISIFMIDPGLLCRFLHPGVILAYLGFHLTLGHWVSALHRKFCIALERGGSNMTRMIVLQQAFSVLGWT